MKNLCYLIVLILGLSTQSARADCNYDPSCDCYRQSDGSPCVNTVYTGVTFLRLTPNARSGAMGDVGIALSPDANALHFNASNLAFTEKKGGVSATYSPWLRKITPDVYLAYLSHFYKINNLQTIGLGLKYFSLGELVLTDQQGNPLGTNKPREWELTLAYSRKLSDNLSAGITGKLITSNLASGQEVDGIKINTVSVGAVDFSMTYKGKIKIGGKKTDLSIGMAVTNIGPKITYTNSTEKDYIPTNLGLGAAWTLDINDHNSITFATDVNKLLVPTPNYPSAADYDEDGNGIPDYREKSPVSGIFSSFGDAPDGFSEELRELMYSFGVEYWYDKQFALRAGYFTEHETKGGRRYMTFGLGLKYNVVGIDISYLISTTNQISPLDNTLRFSLLFDLGTSIAEKA